MFKFKIKNTVTTEKNLDNKKEKNIITRYLPFFAFYLHQGMLTTLALQGVVGYFRSEGMNLTQLSWLYIVTIPWIGKFIWAPWCERNSLTFLKNRYLGSLVITHILMIFLLISGSFIDPNFSVWLIISFLTLLMLLSSIHGIYANGILLCTFKKEEHPYATVIQIGGSYSGILLGAFAFLTITQYATWQIGFLFMASVSFLLLISIFFLHTVIEKKTNTKAPSFSFSCLKAIWPGILLSGIYYVAARGLMSLETVFLIDQGLSMSKVGTVLTVNNTILSGIGILLGGFIIRRLKPLKCVITVMTIHLFIAVIFVVGQSQFNLIDWIVLYGIFSIFAAVGFVTLYSILMSMVRPHQPATDYALFQSMDMTLAMVMSVVAVRVAQNGYGASYLIMAGISLLSMLVIIPLRKKIFNNTNTVK